MSRMAAQKFDQPVSRMETADVRVRPTKILPQK